MSQRFLQLEAAYERYWSGGMPECEHKSLSFRDWMTWAIKQPVDAFEAIESDRESPQQKWDCRTYRLAAGRLLEECEALRPRPNLHAYRHVAGWLSEPEAAALQAITRDKVVLEIGTWKAKSTIAMAATAYHVVAVDHFAGDGFAGVGNPGTQAWENVVKAEAQERVTMMFTPWATAQNFLSISDYDVVFYDGDHTYEATMNFLDFVWRRSPCSQVIAVHDYDDKPQHAGCRRAVDRFSRACGSEIELHDTLAIMKPKL